MHKVRFWPLAGVVAVAAGLITAGASAGGPAAPQATPKKGGTVIFGNDQEPKVFNPYITEGNLYALSVVINPVLQGGQILNDKAAFVPALMAAKPKLTKTSPQTVVFSYKANARWSDGRQITAKDFRATWQAHINKKWDITSRSGWEDIAAVRGTGKKVTVVFKKGKKYADWEALVSTAPVPAHKVAGKNFNQLWRNGIDIASGPFKFQRWDKGNQVVLVPNTRYGGKKPNISRLIFRFIEDTNTQFQALRGGEVHVLEPQPQLQIADMRKVRSVKVQSGPGFIWEHIDIQQGPKGHPALKKKYVRQALITGINRPQISGALYKAIAPGLPVLHSTIFQPFQAGKYKANWRKWSFSQRKAIQILRANGCTGGPARPGAGGIYSCPGVGELSFRFTTTAGNQLRELTFQVIQTQLKSIGIELKSAIGPAATVFGTVLPGGDWDLFMFAWIGGPTTWNDDIDIHGCGGDQNYMNYCNRTVHRLLLRAQQELNEGKRVGLVNRADAIMSNDIPQIPLFARPTFLLFNQSVLGPKRNPTQEGPAWNANVWSVR